MASCSTARPGAAWKAQGYIHTAAHACTICTEGPEAHLRKLLDVKACAEAPAAACDHNGCHIRAVVGLTRVVGQGRQHCNPQQTGSATVSTLFELRSM